MRELFKALSELENNLMEVNGVNLNEGMVLCSIGQDTLTASAICQLTGLLPSHASKVLRSIEQKELVVRSLGDTDKRQMNFSLTEKGLACLEGIRTNELDIPEMLQVFFQDGLKA